MFWFGYIFLLSESQPSSNEHWSQDMIFKELDQLFQTFSGFKCHLLDTYGQYEKKK